MTGFRCSSFELGFVQTRLYVFYGHACVNHDYLIMLVYV